MPVIGSPLLTLTACEDRRAALSVPINGTCQCPINATYQSPLVPVSAT
ncbi:unnamed protein product [Staurois parvus]|uniref:Uncharacterized protein n=1 Tax=Staurois parvus TaxID=386267 RepID=A0ABN9HIG3_9NEOB|nr:unnamed protein product [Staurois parvus]